MVDRDIGKMFPNFMLSKEVRPYYRVDIRDVRTEEEWEKGRLGGWKRLERNMTGLTNSSYNDCQAVIWDKDMKMIDKRDLIFILSG